MRAPFLVALFAKGEFIRLEKRDTDDEAHAFAEGYSAGANAYGAGDCPAYVLPEQEDEMRRDETEDEVAKTLEAVAAVLDIAAGEP